MEEIGWMTLAKRRSQQNLFFIKMDLTLAAITLDVRTSFPFDRSLNVSPLLAVVVAIVIDVWYLLYYYYSMSMLALVVVAVKKISKSENDGGREQSQRQKTKRRNAIHNFWQWAEGEGVEGTLWSMWVGGGGWRKISRGGLRSISLCKPSFFTLSQVLQDDRQAQCKRQVQLTDLQSLHDLKDLQDLKSTNAHHRLLLTQTNLNFVNSQNLKLTVMPW